MSAYLLGTTLGALATALVVWVLGGFLDLLGTPIRAGLILGGAAWVALATFGPLRGSVKLPESRRQIPAEVFGGSLTRGAFRFGLELGVGLRTYVSSPAPYIVLLAVVVGGFTLESALLIGVGFGVGRAMPLGAQLTMGGGPSLESLSGRLPNLVSPAAGMAAVVVVTAGVLRCV